MARVGIGKGMGKGKTTTQPDPYWLGKSFLAGLRKIGCEGRGHVSRALDRTPGREGGDLEAGVGSPMGSAGSWE